MNKGQGLWRTAVAMALPLVIVAGCSNGESNKGSKQLPAAVSLSVADVEQVIAHGVAEAHARGARATIAVVDRVGNVVGVFKMTGAADSFVVTSGTGVVGGLDGADVPAVLRSELAAIAKALTAAYFSSAGNAFTSRTAGQIIQENFTPGERDKPAGPLFGVQFSQLSCSEVNTRATSGTIGPKRSPLGFAADPGGLPLYKNGTVVGAVGVIADGIYSLDRNAADVDDDLDEPVALAASTSLAAPRDIRADRISVEGRFLRFVDREALASDPAAAAPFAAINGVAGTLIAVPGYTPAAISPGTVYGDPASGIRADDNPALAQVDAFVLVDAANANRFPPIAGTDGLLTAAEVTQILRSSLAVANRARSQVRRPVGSTAQVSSVVVDTNGAILGYVRSPDALVDSVDVVVQKARTAVFFSRPNAAAELAALPPANYLPSAGGAVSPIADYVAASQSFFGNVAAFADGIAFSSRSIGNIATPFFPDGVRGKPNGPFARPIANWSLFNNGLSLDLVYNQLVAFLVNPDGPIPPGGCTGNPRIANGITLFGGGLPIYRGAQLVGAIGVSGDGTEQSDLIAYRGLEEAAAALGTGVGNAPRSIRADTLTPQGVRLRYVACPVAPFNNSDEQNGCEGS